MNIYMIENLLPFEYDTYRGLVVAAADVDEAFKIARSYTWSENLAGDIPVKRKDLKITVIGVANEGTDACVFLVDFHAG